MHELSIVSGIIDAVNARRETHGFSRVTAIELICGKWSCLSEESIRFAFAAVAVSTCMEGAEIRIIREEEAFRCAACGKPFTPPDATAGEPRCPVCGSTDAECFAPDSMYIRALEVE